MPFEEIAPITAVKIVDISTRNFDPDPASAEVQSIQYSVQILLSNGEIMIDKGNLVPQLTAAQIETQQDFMVELRALANARYLPTA